MYTIPQHDVEQATYQQLCSWLTADNIDTETHVRVIAELKERENGGGSEAVWGT